MSHPSPTVAAVFVTGGNIVYSASDLASAARCEYALLRDLDAKLGRGPVVVNEDELLARTAVLGDEHERRRLDRLRAEFGDGIAVIGRPAYTHAGLTAAAEATRRAIANRAPVVYQAAMFDGRFVGFADFLIRDGERYRVTDTKLARSPKVTALLQLAAYADALTAAGVPIAPDAELELGDGTVVRYRAQRPDAGLPNPARTTATAARRALRRRARRALGRRRGAGLLPLSAVYRAVARDRRSAAGRRYANQPAREAD